jgi:SAM-dependent MidA family methyltransferase
LDVGRFLLLETGDPALIEIIRAEIKTRGPQSFAWFMQEALYHPEHGYYSSGRAAIGRRGDYFTNVSVGPLFGRLLAAQIAETWERFGQINNFIIVEQGAHDGEFARDLLEAARKHHPEFFEALRYQIIESFPILQDRQSQTLAAFEKISWHRSLDELDPFSGVHFSNELIDAMPVHLRGKLVDLDGDKFVFVNRTDDGPKKTNQTALDWIDNLSTKLQRGFVIAIDYGFPRDQFREVLQVRVQHRDLDSPFEQIGNADITAHINWTDVAERAETSGLRVVGFTDQHHFVTGIISELLRGEFENDTDPKTRRALQTLLHPEMLGRAFQVLALAKDGPAADTAAATEDVDLPLAGFKFARDARSTLGI